MRMQACLLMHWPAWPETDPPGPGLLTRTRSCHRYVYTQALHALSAPGSRAVITAPPSASERDSAAARGMKLHHATFEEAPTTLAR